MCVVCSLSVVCLFVCVGFVVDMVVRVRVCVTCRMFVCAFRVVVVLSVACCLLGCLVACLLFVCLFV